LKPKIPSAKDQLNHKLQIPNYKLTRLRRVNIKSQASNSKHHAKGRQESQIPNTNYPDYSDFSSIDENIFFNLFGLLYDYKVWSFEFRLL